ncbi:MAG: single-stranded DNA-binding protein [Elusimicrobia bacterium]|nr:single-stranded DNA-binding protein [Elusimicrobiota bacterium]
MGNLNKVMLIGRLTRDPEIKEFSNGGKVANIGFAVNNRRKNQQSGQWEEVPVWVDLKAFDRESGRKLADLAEKHLHKGHQIYVEGHLVREEWTGKEDGKKQSKMLVYVDNIQFLEKREGSAPSGTEPTEPAAAKAAGADTGAKEEGIEEVPF